MTNSTSAPKYLSKSELREVCPIAFDKTPTNPDVSKHYVHVNTETIIDDMAKLGWKPVGATMRNRTKKDTIFSRHMVSFQNEDIFIDGDEKAFPRILLTNSHDGKNAFKFHVGIFRLVCSNGLVVATETFNHFRVRHQGYTFNELRQVVIDAVGGLPEHVTVMNKMVKRILTDEEKHVLAVDSLLTRLGLDTSDKTERAKIDEYTVDQILAPVRDGDKGDDLWRVFNVVQEKMIRGGFESSVTTGKKKYRQVRPITNFVRDMELNQELFQLANAMV